MIKETKNKNLIIRLMERLKFGANLSKAHKPGNIKLKKKVVLIAMTGILGASLLFTGCNSNDGISTNNNITEKQRSSNISTSSITDILEPEEIDFLEEMSKAEYQQAIDKYNAGNDNLLKAYSHPLSFLASKGYDTNAIKTGEIEFKTFSYVKESEPNNLYIMTSTFVHDEVEIEDNSYYTKYLLKYELTDNEMQAYKHLYDNNYIQANMVIASLSKLKNEIVVADVKIGERENYDSIKFINAMITTDTKWAVEASDTIIVDYSLEDQSCKYLIFSEEGGKISTYFVSYCYDFRTVDIDGETVIKLSKQVRIEEERNEFIDQAERVTYYISDLAINTIKDLGN